MSPPEPVLVGELGLVPLNALPTLSALLLRLDLSHRKANSIASKATTAPAMLPPMIVALCVVLSGGYEIPLLGDCV